MGRHDPLLDQVLAQLNRPALDKSVGCYFHFAAGKIYDNIGDYSLAFKHYTQGNEDANKEFDSADFRRQIKDTIYVYSQDYLKSIAGSGHDSRLKPVAEIPGIPIEPPVTISLKRSPI